MSSNIQMFIAYWHLPCNCIQPQRRALIRGWRYRVPYKVFNAPDGTKWEVWMVNPTSTDRRHGEEFGQSSASANSATTGVTDRRRADSGPRTVVSPGFENGWLCFESSSGEKRRLVPVPDGWDIASADKLWMWCRAAAEVPRCDPG
jgi:hypothetical protein